MSYFFVAGLTLASLLSQPFARAATCDELIAKLATLRLHERKPQDAVGIESPAAGTKNRMDNLKEDEYFIYVFDRRLGFLWAKRDPENGQRPTSYATTMYTGHGSLIARVAELRGEAADLIDAGEAVKRGGKIFVSNRSSLAKPGPQGAPLSLAAMKELGIEESGTIIENFGTGDEMASINTEGLHAATAGDLYHKTKVQADPRAQRAHAQLSVYWSKLAALHLRPGILLDLNSVLAKMEVLKDQALDAGEYEALPRLDGYILVLQRLHHGESLNFIVDDFMNNRAFAAYHDNFDKFIAELHGTLPDEL